MKIKSMHGFFIFEETRVGQVADFMVISGFKLAPYGKYFTFEKLVNAPRYSLEGKDLLGFKAIKTFEGEPWEVFKANGIVYDFTTDSVKPIASISVNAQIKSGGYKFFSEGLILPGSTTDVGRVTDYSAWYSRERSALSFFYSEVAYV